ncbi:MAG: hypothetical protein JNM27_08180, partial [Leptospirales bacterium]|nr:hypothetical protein [Leptospirales bacterium]
MPKTQYYTATSLDGFIADSNNSLDWLFASGNEEGSGHEDFASFFGNIGAFCMGRTTYEWILDHEKLLEDPAKWQS